MRLNASEILIRHVDKHLDRRASSAGVASCDGDIGREGAVERKRGETLRYGDGSCALEERDPGATQVTLVADIHARVARSHYQYSVVAIRFSTVERGRMADHDGRGVLAWQMWYDRFGSLTRRPYKVLWLEYHR